MVKHCKIDILHAKGDQCQIFDCEGKLTAVSLSEKTSEKTCFDIMSEQDTLDVYLEQRHPLKQKLWWYPLLIPICFVQNYLLKYEWLAVDDYFARLKVKIILQAETSYLTIKLDRISSDYLIEKTFYFNFRKDSHLVPRIRPYFCKFHLVKADNCIIEQYNLALPIDSIFLKRWRIVRIVPAVFTYGILIGTFIFYFVKEITFKNYIPAFVLLLFASVIGGVLVEIIKGIKEKRFRQE